MAARSRSLIDDVMNLRSQGFRPSNGNAQALLGALDKRPNQTPLVDALRATLAYQRKLQTQSAMAESGEGGSTPQAPSWAPVPGQDNNPFLPPQWDINPCELRVDLLMLDEKLLSILVCPEDRGPLLLVGDELLYNPRLRRAYRIEDGVPVLLIDEAVTVTDDAEHNRLLERASGESG